MSSTEESPPREAHLKLGLLMETADTQQRMAAAALEQLQSHAEGLDAIVRDEIRATLVEELRKLSGDIQRAAQSLHALRHAANLRLLAWSVGVMTLSAAVPIGLARWLLPTRGEVAELAAARDQLTVNIAGLKAEGGKIELRHCGPTQRLCVRIDRSAPSFGEGADYLVVKGY